MSQKIRLKRTDVSGRTAVDAQLLSGELAMNTIDGLLWGKGQNVFEIITENRVYSPVTNLNKVVTEAELDTLINDYQLNNVVTFDQQTLPGSQNFTGDGTTVTYTLTNTPASADAIDVYVDDVLQRPEEVFSVTGNTLTFSTVPYDGADIYIKYRYAFATIMDNPDGSIENRHLNLTYTSDQFTNDGSQTVYTIESGHTVHDVLVIINGLIQPPYAYTIDGTTLTLATAPMVGSVVDFRYLPV
jgi:hypothetical protein